MIPYETLINVIKLGGNVIVASNLPYDILITITKLVANTGKTVTIRNASHLPYDSLMNIVRVGGGNVIFDFYEEEAK